MGVVKQFEEFFFILFVYVYKKPGLESKNKTN